ncbi:MAG: ABC transporter permease [Gammaproteobacteria bacterium]|jgi:peptide/nickel transport system permease protein|nr:ABC transporter permease [Gammaproteobacteria bacterium]MBT7226708.1 ABC transporter permease [Gammaproteobacteria bacterium]
MSELRELSPRRLAWLRFRRHRLAMLAGSFLVFLYTIAAFCEFISPYTPEQRNVKAINAPPMDIRFIDAGGQFHFRPFVYDLKLTINPDTWMREYEEDTSTPYPIRFFAKGVPYELWGVISAERHLFSVDPEGAGYIHWFGTDSLGRDMFSRVLYGARVSLSIGIVGVGLTLFLGVLLGGFAGYSGGIIDSTVQRITEVLQSIPTLPLWMALSAALPTAWSPITTYFGVTIILSLFGWTTLARQVRGRFLAMREEDFVIAARLLGANDSRVIFRHMLPSFSSHIITTATLAVPAMILGETALSFLGIGLRAPVVSWGVLLQQAQNYQVIVMTPWLLLPGAFIVVTVIAFNLLGDGLRDAADPYSSLSEK